MNHVIQTIRSSHLLEMASQFGPELLTAKTKEKKGSLSRFAIWKIKQMGYTEQVQLLVIKKKRKK